MKRIKGLLAAILSAALLCPITAYAAPSEEALALYKEVEAGQKAMTDMNAVYDFNIRMSGSMLEAQGQSPMDIKMEMNVMVNHVTDPENLGYMAYTRAVLPGGQQSVSTMYYKDGYCYMEAGNAKVKYPMALGQVMQQTMASANAFQTSEDLLENLSLRTEGENRILSYTIRDDKMNEYLQMVMGSTGLSGMMGAMNLTVSNIQGEYVVNPEGKCVNMYLKMDMSMDTEGQSLNMSLDGSIGIVNPGEPVEIPYPDLTQYQEMTQNTAAAEAAQ